VLGGALAALVLTGLAAVLVLLVTAPGQALVRRWGVAALANQIDGQVRVGSVGGSLWRAADLRDIAFDLPDGTPVIRAERLRVTFALTDLLRRRFRFSHVTLVRPVVTLRPMPDGRLNVEHLFRLGLHDSTGGGGARPLVDLRGVTLAEGTLVVRDSSADGVQVRRIEHINVELDRLRLSHPDSAAIAARVRRMAARLDAPALTLQDGRGDLRLAGDSLHFDLEHVTLPHSHADTRGLLVLGGPHLRLDAAIDASRFDVADLRGLVQNLPAEGSGRASVRVQLPGDGAAVVEIRDARLGSGRTSAEVRGTVAIGVHGGISLRGLDVMAQPLDLALLAPLADSLPVRGLVSGRIGATGALRDLLADLDVTWTDEAVPGGAVNRVSGRGHLILGGADGLAFRSFTVRRVDADLRTIHHFAEVVDLRGRLVAVGTLDGPWTDARFAGGLEHVGPPGLASAMRGTLQLGLTSPSHIEADLAVDSLSPALLHLSYPSIPAAASLRGHVVLHGPLTALAVRADLRGAAGVVHAEGTIGAGDSAVTLAGSGTFDSLDAEVLDPSAPPTVLQGAWALDLTVPGDTAQGTTGTLRADLRHGLATGVALGAGAVALRLEPARVVVDSARLAFAGGAASASGAIGRETGHAAQVRFTVRTDTLTYLEPLLRWARREAGDSSAVRLEGAGRVSGRVAGTLEEWTLESDFGVEAADAAGGRARQLHGRANLARRGGGFTVDAELAADTVAAQGLTYAPVAVAVHGPMDSLDITLTSGFVLGSEVRTHFITWGDSAVRIVRLDSLAIDLPSHTWQLVRPGVVVVEPDRITLDTLALRTTAGIGILRVRGALPRRGMANFTLEADSVPVADLYALAQRDTAGVSGAMNGELRVSGPAESPTMDARVALTEGRFGDYRLPLFQVLARYTDRRLTLKGGLWRDSVRLVTLSGSLPLDLSLVPVEQRQLPGAIAVVAKADTLDMAVLSPLTTVARDVSGRMVLDVGVSGTWEQPVYRGYVDVIDGALTVPSLGARYTGIDVRLGLSGGIVRIVRGQITGGSGVLSLSGQADLGSLTHPQPRLDVTLRMTRFAAFNLPQFGALTGSGELHLRGPLLGDTLTGSLVVDQGYLQFADLVQKRIVNLDDPEFRALVDSNLSRSEDLAPPAHAIFLDSLRIDSVRVSMGNDVWLRSTEANIQLAGDFQVDKKIEDRLPRYRFDGTLHAVRGNYRLDLGFENLPVALARDFRVTRGTVRFFGTPDFNPELDIVAEHVVRTVQGQPLTVRALIGGTLLFPRLRLESDQRPPLTETEIVSYLMFGRPPSAASRGQGAAQALVGDIIGGVGQALVSELGLPLSYLTIVPGAARANNSLGVSTARIEAGVQVGERTFLTVNAGLCEVLAQQLVGATLEYRLSRRWTVAAAFEPVIKQCGTAVSLSGLTRDYQFGFDLFWQQGIR